MTQSPKKASATGALIVAALFASALEGWGAAVAAYRTAPSFEAALVGWFLAFALLCVVLVPLGAVVGAICDTAPLRNLARALGQGFGGADQNSSLALVVILLSAGGAFFAGLLQGKLLVQQLSPAFGAAGTAAVTLLVFVALLAGLSLGASWSGGVVNRLTRLTGKLRVSGVTLVVAVTGGSISLALGSGIDRPYAYLPLGLTFGLTWALVSAPLSRRPWFASFRGRATFVAGVVGLCLPAVVFPHYAPPASQGAVLFKAPYLSVMVATIERATDGDGDGFSPYLFGKDCNDADPKIYPGAVEVPANGVDENCSGRDSEHYQPIERPPSKRPEALASKMNVLLILVDALRPDRLHFAGYERETSPHLDEFRKGATWFKNSFTTAPQTRDAFASLLTARYPMRLGIEYHEGTYTLPSQHKTFPEMLKQSGYDNLGYTITYVDKRFRGYGQGFRSFAAPWGPKPWEYEWKRAAPLTTRAAVNHLRTQDDKKPWLLFLHYRCTHDPYYVWEKNFGNTNSDKYDSGLHHCDRNLAPVLKAAQERSDADRTAIILFSDHGEVFGEHGGHYHAETLFDPDVRTLLLAKIPGAKRSTVEAPVNIADLGATIMSLAGRRVPRKADGWDLLPLMFEEKPHPAWLKRPLFATTDLHRANIHYTAASVIQYPEKYIWDMRTGMRGLFDLEKDPAEMAPIKDKEKNARAAKLLEQWLASTAPPAFVNTGKK